MRRSIRLTRRSVRAPVAALASLALAVALLLGAGTALPRIAVACSCVGPQPLAAYAGPETAIFAGTVVGDDADGVRVGVERWFSGDGAAPVVLLAGDFGNGASCGIGSRPPVGSRWIWVAWRAPAEGLANPLDARPLTVNICQPFADLATPDGEALLAEAEAAFGQGAGVPEPSPADTGASPGTDPGGSPAAGGGSDAVLPAAVAVAVLVGIAILGGALLLGTRGRRDTR